MFQPSAGFNYAPQQQMQQPPQFRLQQFPPQQYQPATTPPPQQFPVGNSINTPQFQPAAQQVHQVQQFAPRPHQQQQQQQQQYQQQFGTPPPSATPPIPPSAQIQQVQVEPTSGDVPKIYEQQFRSQPNQIYTQQQERHLQIQQRSLPDGAYGAEEKLTDGAHPSYIENTAKTTPAEQFRRVLQPQVVISRPQSFVQSPNPPFKANEVAGSIRRPAPRPRLPVQNRVRVFTSTRSPPETQPAIVNVVPQVATSSKSKAANQVFLSCCKSVNVDKPCERICNFDVLNKKTLTGMFLGTDPCPQSNGLALLQCAAQSDDHKQCCISRGVHTTTAGNKCLGFCDMRPGITFQADVSMLPCWGVLGDIKTCFREHIQKKISAA